MCLLRELCASESVSISRNVGTGMDGRRWQELSVSRNDLRLDRTELLLPDDNDDNDDNDDDNDDNSADNDLVNPWRKRVDDNFTRLCYHHGRRCPWNNSARHHNDRGADQHHRAN